MDKIEIGFFGKTNSGKSSLMNKLLNQNYSLTSPVSGTTTDPVRKAMEFIPIGPVVFTDTAGLNDNTELGLLRVEKTLEVLLKIDLAIYVMDINDLDHKVYNETLLQFKKYNIPHILVINKIDTMNSKEIQHIKESFNNGIFISCIENEGIEILKNSIINIVKETMEDNESIIGNVVPYNSNVIMVVPIDSEAPKGRLILPQVQLIRDCLDHGIKSLVVRDTELKNAIEDIKKVDLIVTDSQCFKKVDSIIPKNIKLTSFSILLANQKGDLKEYLKGIEAINSLNENSKILICESCTHNTSHEDIGTVKIPKMLCKKVGKSLNFQFSMGKDFPKNIQDYDLVIHCGGCMTNKRLMKNKINICKNNNVPITNYGMVIAYLTGILERTVEIFKK